MRGNELLAQLAGLVPLVGEICERYELFGNHPWRRYRWRHMAMLTTTRP
jgi:hypothetical protein